MKLRTFLKSSSRCEEALTSFALRLRKQGYLSLVTSAATRNRGLVVSGGIVILLLGAIACSTVNRAVVQLPDVPGASYVGSADCEQCHEEIYRDFQTADHARLMAEGTNALNAGCESCHGPCSLHEQSGGTVKTPFSYTAGRPLAGDFDARLGVTAWRSKDTVCFQCHADVRSQFNLPSHHPVPEGDLSCISCHDPHKGSVRPGGGTSLLSENDSCLQCHSEQRGPFVFEHQALREGCTVCHAPHGSINAKLLIERDANLCLKCHFQQVSGGQLLIGGSDHTLRVQEGTCWSAGCHEAVHGSRVSSALRF
jgi:predicted CXXCH cytochrome family protein